MSAAELTSMQEAMALAYSTEATITRPEYGSDELGDDAAGTDPPAIGTVFGWLTSAPTAEATNDGGIVTVNTYRWNCPPATDIKPRDRLVINGSTYIVTDTTADETMPVALSCSLRLRE